MPRISQRDDYQPQDIEQLLENNKAWVESIQAESPGYFSQWAVDQKPKYFWLGCADSRVVAEACTGLNVGELFVHRNIGNILSHSDVNGTSALEYSVKVLGVKHVLVCGHTNCGAVKAALTMPSKSSMITNCWISNIRTTRNEHAGELAALKPEDATMRLVQLNVAKQVFNVCTSPVIQQAWDSGTEVRVHGLVYDVATGALDRIVGPISGNDEVPDEQHLDFASLQVKGDKGEGVHSLAEALHTLQALKSTRSRSSLDGLMSVNTEDGALPRDRPNAVRKLLVGIKETEALKSPHSKEGSAHHTSTRRVPRLVSEQLSSHMAFESTGTQVTRPSNGKRRPAKRGPAWRAALTGSAALAVAGWLVVKYAVPARRADCCTSGKGEPRAGPSLPTVSEEDAEPRAEPPLSSVAEEGAEPLDDLPLPSVGEDCDGLLDGLPLPSVGEDGGDVASPV